MSALVALVLALGFVGGVDSAPARAALTTLNDNTDVFQISFTGLTSMTSLANKALLNPNNLQVQWSLNPTYNSATKNYDVGTDWINITSVNNALTTSFVPTSGSGPNGTVAALSPIVSTDIVVMTIRANPLNAASASLGGYLGKQLTAGLRTALTLGSHSSTNTNPYDKELLSFGSFTGFAVLEDAFSGVPSTFTMSAKLPTTVTNLSYAFGNPTATQYYNASEITLWDTSNVTNMSSMFYNNRVFNQSLSNWNTSNVTTMANMFYSAIAFNNGLAQGLSGTLAWNTASVTDMTAMFYNSNSFNQQIDSWNTGQVTNMYMMFQVANKFNQNLNSWDVSRVTNMSSMFTNATIFNGNISSWNTVNVTNMTGMFNGALAFNQAVGSWNVAKVTTMVSMFNGATSFNQNLNSWQLSQVTSLSNMFNGATSFNNGNASGVIGDMTWTMSSTVTTMASMFKGATAFNQNVTTWNTSNVTDMSEVFQQASKFNGTVNGWDTAKVTTLTRTFYGATIFNQPVSNWNVSRVVNFAAMFQSAVAFNQDLNSWVPSSANFLDFMFYSATSFNNGLPSGTAGSMTWSNLKLVTTFSDMFNRATSFNQNLNSWVMDRGVTSYKNMFYGATSFNNGNAAAMTWTLVYRIPLSTAASPATDMTSMFQGASSFNQNLNSWNVSFVSLMPNMFQNASSFNNGLASGLSGSMSWKMAGSTSDISGMFQNATSFNQSLSTWVTTGTSRFYSLLTGATSFDQNLANFDIVSWQNATGITFPASMSSANVQATIKSWAWQSRPITMAINLDSTHTVYSDCASYNAFLQFIGSSSINNGIRPTAPTCSNTAALTWSPDTAIVAPTVVNGTNQAASNLYSFTPSALPAGGNDYLYATLTAACQVDPNSGVVIYRGGTTSCTIRVVDPTITGAGTTSGSFVDVTFSLTTYTAPGSPTASVASIVDGSTVRVSWTAPTSTGGTSLVSYFAYYAAASAPSVYVEGCLVNAPATTCDITGLTTGTSYTFKVTAWNGIAYSPLTGATATASLIPDVAPGAPTITSIEPGGSGNQIVISYTAGANSGSAITGYEYSTNNGTNWKAVPTVTSTTLTIAQESGSTSTLAFGSTYTIKIRAKNSMSGAESNAMTGYPEIRKNAPTITSITGSFTTLTVAFTAPTTPAGGNAITTYEYSTDAGQTWKQRETGTTGTSLVISTLSSSSAALVTATTYPVQIRAKNLLSGLASTTTNGTTDIAPGAPTIGTITGGYLQLSVPFTPGSNSGTAITKYQYSTDAGSTWADFAGTTSPQLITHRSSDGLRLANRTTYSVRIRAYNSVGGTQTATTYGTTTDPAPGAPSSLSATAGDGQVTVTFIDGANTGSAITKYQYSFDGSNWVDAVGTSSPITITGLTNGTSYFVQLRAFNTSAGTASTPSASVTPNVALAAPTNVTATISGFTATISWTAPVGNVSSYDVTSDVGSFTCSTSDPLYATPTTCQISGLASGTTYSFSVTATNSRGTSTSSTPSNSVTTPTTPGSPTSVVATSSGTDATITWLAGSGAPATSYSVIATPSGLTCVATAPATNCAISGLTLGTAYTFSVVAINGAGSSAASVASVAIIPENAPGAPTISSIDVDSQQLAIHFTAGTNTGTAITKYQFSTDAGVTWADLPGLTSPQTITTDSLSANLVDNTSYPVTIRAVNNLAGSDSNSVAAIPNSTLNAPTNASVSLSGTSATISWTAPTGNIDSYSVGSNTGSFSCSTTNTSCVISGLVLGVTYNFTVTATNSAGTSPASTATSSITPDIAPGAPTIDGLSVGDEQLSIAFTAGSNSGSAITKYRYTTDSGSTWKDLPAITSPQIITTTSANVPLVNDTPYTVELRAFNTMEGSSSAAVTATPNVSLAAPTLVSATVSGNTATVAWSAPSGAVSNYTVTSSPGSLTCSTSVGTSCLVSGLTYGLSYTFRVTATNSAGTSSQSASSNAVVPEVSPGAPTIDVTPGDKQFSIAFTAGANSGSAITKYQYTTDAGTSWRDLTGQVGPFVVNRTSTNALFVNGQSYQVGLRAVNTAFGTNSGYTTIAPNIAPPRPSTYWISGDNQVLYIAWAPGSPNLGSAVTKYQYTTDQGATWKDIAGLPTGPVTTTITTTSDNLALVNGNAYTVFIRSVNTIPSVMSQGVTAPVDVILSAPVVASVDAGDSQLTINYSLPPLGGSTVTGAYYSTDGGSTWRNAGSNYSSPLTITSTSDGSSLVNGTTYRVQLKIRNTQLGLASATIETAPDIAPSAPTITTVTTSGNQLSVDFIPASSAGSAITKYQYSTDDGVSWRDCANGTTSPTVITRQSDDNSLLTNGNLYGIKLRAFNTLNGTASSKVDATPNIVPLAVSNLVAASADSAVDLTWTAPANTSVSDYLIEYSVSGSNTFSTFTRAASNATSETITGLSNGTAYVVRITAINGTSVGVATLSADVTPRANQTALTWNLSATSIPYLGTLILGTSGGTGNGAVTYSRTSSSTCTIASNILTAGEVGTSCVITATKASDSAGTLNPTSTASLTITVTRINQVATLVFTNSAQMDYGNVLNVNAVGGSGTGALEYSVVNAGTTGCVVNQTTGELSVTASGTCQVGAKRLASTNYNESQIATQNIQVTTANQQIAFTSAIPTTPVAGGSYSPTAQSSAGLPVDFSIASGPCTHSNSMITFSSSGVCVIKGSQGGNSQYSAAPDVYQSIAIGQRNQILTWTTATAAKVAATYSDPAFLISAQTSESNSQVTYSAVNVQGNACSVSVQGLVTIDAVGLCSIQADAPADSGATFAIASPIIHTITISPALATAPTISSLASGNGSVTLNFTPPSYTGGSAIAGYQIIAQPQDPAFATVNESGCGVTPGLSGEVTCTARGLVNGVNYRMKVAAVTAAGVGVYSNLSNPILVASNPSAVQGLNVVQANSKLTLNWTDPDSLGGGTFVAYRIFIKLSTSSIYDSANYFEVTNYALNNFEATTLSPVGSNLVNGTAYDIKIVTITSANSSELSANTAVANQIPFTVPGSPTFSAALIVEPNVVLTWQAPANDGGRGITSYEAQLGSTNCVFANAQDTYCTVPKPSVGGVYSYSIKAVNLAGPGDASTGNVQVGSTPTPTPTPTPTANPAADPDAVASGSLSNELTRPGATGIATFSDGSVMAVSPKGVITPKVRTGYTGLITGSVIVTYRDAKNKLISYKCPVAFKFGTTKPNKKAKINPRTGRFPKLLYTSNKSCKLPAKVLVAFKAKPVSMLAKFKFVRLWPPTGKPYRPNKSKIGTIALTYKVNYGRR